MRSIFGYAVCESYWILLWSCLKMVSGYVGSRPLCRDSGAGQCQMWFVSGPWQPAGAPSNPLFVAFSAELGYFQEGLRCAPWPAFTRTGIGGSSATVLRLCDKVTSACFCLWGSVTEKASGRVGIMELVDRLWNGGAVQASGKVMGIVPSPEPQDSICAIFCTYLSREEPLGVKQVGLLEPEGRICWKQEGDAVWYLMRWKHQSVLRGSESMASIPMPDNSITDTLWACLDFYIPTQAAGFSSRD